MKYYIIAIVIVIAAGTIIGITMASRRNAQNVASPAVGANKNQGAASQSNANSAPVTSTSTTGKSVADRKRLDITVPGQNASQKELDDYYTKVAAQAVSTTRVDIAGCVPDPVIAKFAKANELTFVNPDDKPYTVYYKKDTSVVVPPKSEKKISIDRDGIYAYGCQEQTGSGAAGLLMVTNQ